MRLTTIGALIAGVAVGNQQCDRHVEVMILQDSSTSFYELGTKMAKSMTQLLTKMNEQLGTAKASVALFSDKPVPFRGRGDGRGRPGPLDFCYGNENMYPLGNDPAQLKEGYDAIYTRQSEGGDYPENPYEAIILGAVDPKVQWSPPDAIYDDDNRRIVKVIVTVTDDHPHYDGDAKAGIYSWNPLPAGQEDGDPRFFDADFYSMGALYHGTGDKYNRLVELHDKSSLTIEESVEYLKLIEFLGPAYFDEPIPHPGTFEAFEDCSKYEYPSLETLGRVLNEQNVIPVMLLSGQSRSNTGNRLCASRGFKIPSTGDTTEEWLQCLEAVYTKDFHDAGIHTFMVGRFGDNADALVDQIISLVDKVSRDVSCPDPTTPSPETTSEVQSSGDMNSSNNTDAENSSFPDSTGGVDSTIPASSTGDADSTNQDSTDLDSTIPAPSTGDADSTNQDSTGDINSTIPESTGDDISTEQNSTGDVESTEPQSTNDVSTGNADSTDNTDESQTSEDSGSTDSNTDGEFTTGDADSTYTTDNHERVVPVAPGSGSNTGMIAGATGGAVAGVAALGGLLYKKFGAGLLGHGSPADLSAVEQVEVPETPVEREAFEEVTMDMFQ